jgi:hypothetical protein
MQPWVDELRLIGAVGHNTTDTGRGEDHDLRLLGREERLDVGLAGEIQFTMSSGDDVGVAARLQASQDSAAHEATVAGEVDAC